MLPPTFHQLSVQFDKWFGREMLFEEFQDGHHGDTKWNISSESASFAKARFFY